MNAWVSPWVSSSGSVPMKISVATSSDSDFTAGYMSIGSFVGQVGTVRADDPLDPALVGLEPGPGEGLLHDPPVQQVLLPVEQHQAAGEERADEVLPTGLRPDLALVLEDLLHRVRADRDRDLGAEGADPEDGAVLLVHHGRGVPAVPDHLQRLADDRQAALAHHRLEAAPCRWLGERDRGDADVLPGGRQQPVTGEVEERRPPQRGSLPVARASYDARSGRSSASRKMWSAPSCADPLAGAEREHPGDVEERPGRRGT